MFLSMLNYIVSGQGSLPWVCIGGVYRSHRLRGLLQSRLADEMLRVATERVLTLPVHAQSVCNYNGSFERFRLVLF